MFKKVRKKIQIAEEWRRTTRRRRRRWEKGEEEENIFKSQSHKHLSSFLTVRASNILFVWNKIKWLYAYERFMVVHARIIHINHSYSFFCVYVLLHLMLSFVLKLCDSQILFCESIICDAVHVTCAFVQ